MTAWLLSFLCRAVGNEAACVRKVQLFRLAIFCTRTQRAVIKGCVEGGPQGTFGGEGPVIRHPVSLPRWLLRFLLTWLALPAYLATQRLLVASGVPLEIDRFFEYYSYSVPGTLVRLLYDTRTSRSGIRVQTRSWSPGKYWYTGAAAEYVELRGEHQHMSFTKVYTHPVSRTVEVLHAACKAKLGRCPRSHNRVQAIENTRGSRVYSWVRARGQARVSSHRAISRVLPPCSLQAHPSPPCPLSYAICCPVCSRGHPCTLAFCACTIHPAPPDRERESFPFAPHHRRLWRRTG